MWDKLGSQEQYGGWVAEAPMALIGIFLNFLHLENDISHGF